MNKLVIVAFVALLAIQVDSFVDINPLDLADEVLKLVDELENIVLGQILIGHSNLESSEQEFLTNSNNELIRSELSIQQERDSISEQINIIKNLATSANKDISPCTTIREPLLQRLADEYITQLRNCIQGINREEARVISTSTYNVDITVNKVQSIRFQVTSCNGNLLCLSPIVTEIDLEKVRLPQNIRTEVDFAVNTLTILRLSVGSCSNDNVSQYIADASSLLNDITVCANAILG